MKRIGLLGGMSWESSAEYYRLINEAVRDRLGGLHSADCLLRSVDFVEVEQLQRMGDWNQAGELLAAEATALEAAGAELLVLCTNTMHKVADAITDAIAIPFVHIADTTAQPSTSQGLTTVGLLATAYTMEQDFYVGRLRDLHGLDVLVPDERRPPDRARRDLRGALHRRHQGRSRANTGGSSPGLPTEVPRASCSGAPRSICSSGPRTPRYPSLTRQGCTRTARSTLRWASSRLDADRGYRR